MENYHVRGINLQEKASRLRRGIRGAGVEFMMLKMKMDQTEMELLEKEKTEDRLMQLNNAIERAEESIEGIREYLQMAFN